MKTYMNRMEGCQTDNDCPQGHSCENGNCVPHGVPSGMRFSEPRPLDGPGSNLRFDGISNDFPWNTTQWAMPDSDDDNFNADSDYMNHPGFLGWTWSAKKRERQRRDREMAKVVAAYPNTGDCAVLTDSLDRIDSSIAKHIKEEGQGGRGAKRVRKRGLSTRKERRPSIASAQAAACAEKEQEQAQLAQMLMAPQIQDARNPQQGMNKNLAMILGVGVLAAVGFGIYKLIKR